MQVQGEVPYLFRIGMTELQHNVRGSIRKATLKVKQEKGKGEMG